MGDAVLVAVPAIILIALAVGMIVRGSRQTKTQQKTAKAIWRVGVEPGRINNTIYIYLYKEVDGVAVERKPYAQVIREGDYTDNLLTFQQAAEIEVSLLNSAMR